MALSASLMLISTGVGIGVGTIIRVSSAAMLPSQIGIIALSIILPIVASLVVLLRFFIRRRDKIGRDDWTIFIAVVGKLSLLS